MREKYKKYELVIILCVLALLMASARLFVRIPQGGSEETGQNVTVNSLPTPLPSQTQLGNKEEEKTTEGEPEIALPTNFYDKDYPLWHLLPYVGRGFIVDRYTKPKTLLIKVKGIDKKIIEEDVRKWLEANNEASDSHKLTWDTTGN